MFRAYARFSANHPILHGANLLLVATVFGTSCYQLLAEENIAYSAGLVGVVLPMVLFAKSADYRRKYMNEN